MARMIEDARKAKVETEKNTAEAKAKAEFFERLDKSVDLHDNLEELC
jgi:hypothetical protein